MELTSRSRRQIDCAMTGDFAPKTIQDCTLWRRLVQGFADDGLNKVAASLASSLPDICQLATDRMKQMPAFHPEFTLHDEVHLLRVTELMARVVGEEILSKVLNPIEIALLILAAHFHDTGMVPDKTQADGIRASREYSLLKDNWRIEYPGFQEASNIYRDPNADPLDKIRCAQVVADFESVLFQRFLRETHAERSAAIVKDLLGHDPRLKVGTGHFADPLALLCVSHNWPPERISEADGFLHDKAVGTFPVNLAYLACVLRLADILDFDRERTPDELLRCISFNNPVSISEWEKHRSVDGWKIDKDAVRFECACDRPEYERSIHRFMGWIDDELSAAHGIVRKFPASFCQYKLHLPYRTDRSRIKAKDGAYLYSSDLEISLSRDEIVRLLMTEKLYGRPSLAIRELLQNSWDALRHRAAIMKRDEQMEWTQGSVDFEHGVNAEGREFIRCTDNGVGMSADILKNFLVRAGRSYYRSPEFERERLSFRQKGADFDPCARFGIGFMSVFMLGDRITIKTRKYGGLQGGLGEPLIAEINGIGSLIVLRRGAVDQPPGTVIEIVGRRKPDRFLSHHDKVRLVETIYGYALGCDFPVHAKCTIPEIEDHISLKAGLVVPWHPYVAAGVKKCAIFTQKFSDVHPCLKGATMCALPLTDEGRLTVANQECGWRMAEKLPHPEMWAGRFHAGYLDFRGKTCVDGIFVAGQSGRGTLTFGTSWSANPIQLGECAFVLDVRGELKPELTPHRTPPENTNDPFRVSVTWRRLRRIAARAHGMLWEQVIERFDSKADAKVLWQLMYLHKVHFDTMLRGFLWRKLLLPVVSDTEQLEFRTFEELSPIPFRTEVQGAFSPSRNGTTIGVDREMAAWKDEWMSVFGSVEEAIYGMASLTLDADEPLLTFSPPDEPDSTALSRLTFDSFGRSIPSMPFGSGLEACLAAEAASVWINARHPVFQWLLVRQEKTEGDCNFDFLHRLASALIEKGALKALATGSLTNQEHNFHFSTLGYYFREAELDSLDKPLLPPYKCWHHEHGFFEITADLLKKLAEIQIIDWHRELIASRVDC